MGARGVAFCLAIAAHAALAYGLTLQVGSGAELYRAVGNASVDTILLGAYTIVTAEVWPSQNLLERNLTIAAAPELRAAGCRAVLDLSQLFNRILIKPGVALTFNYVTFENVHMPTGKTAQFFSYSPNSRLIWINTTSWRVAGLGVDTAAAFIRIMPRPAGEGNASQRVALLQPGTFCYATADPGVLPYQPVRHCVPYTVQLSQDVVGDVGADTSSETTSGILGGYVHDARDHAYWVEHPIAPTCMQTKPLTVCVGEMLAALDAAAAKSGGQSSGLSTGELVAAIVVPCAVAVLMVVLLAILLLRWRRRASLEKSRSHGSGGLLFGGLNEGEQPEWREPQKELLVGASGADAGTKQLGTSVKTASIGGKALTADSCASGAEDTEESNRRALATAVGPDTLTNVPRGDGAAAATTTSFDGDDGGARLLAAEVEITLRPDAGRLHAALAALEDDAAQKLAEEKRRTQQLQDATLLRPRTLGQGVGAATPSGEAAAADGFAAAARPGQAAGATLEAGEPHSNGGGGGGGGDGGAKQSRPPAQAQAEAAPETLAPGGSEQQGGAGKAPASTARQPNSNAQSDSRPMSKSGTHSADLVAAELAALKREAAAVKDVQLRIRAVLGQGGYGTVYQGEWQGLDVAIKVVLFNSAHNSRTAALREAALLMSISHPNIASAYLVDVQPLVAAGDAASSRPLSAQGALGPSAAGGGEAPAADGAGSKRAAELPGLMDYRLYIVQEFCDAGPLRRLITSGALLQNKAASGGDSCDAGPTTRTPRLSLVYTLALGVARALTHLHSKNIVHSDLTPNNILLRSDSRAPFGMAVKVADFGLSVLVPGSRTHLSNRMCGSPFYIAPEVYARGQLSPAADLFSFGVVMWELVCSTRAGLRDGDGQLRYCPAFPATPPSCPSLFRKLVHWCLQRDPSRRPTAAKVVAVLHNLLEEQLAEDMRG